MGEERLRWVAADIIEHLAGSHVAGGRVSQGVAGCGGHVTAYTGTGWDHGAELGSNEPSLDRQTHLHLFCHHSVGHSSIAGFCCPMRQQSVRLWLRLRSILA